MSILNGVPGVGCQIQEMAMLPGPLCSTAYWLFILTDIPDSGTLLVLPYTINGSRPSNYFTRIQIPSLCFTTTV